MKKALLILASLTTLTFLGYRWFSSPSSTNKVNSLPTIGIIQLVEHPALDETRKGIISELKENGYVDGKNIRLIYDSAQGNPALASQIAQKYAGEKAQVIIALGTTAAQASKQATANQKIPVVFSSVTDPKNAKLVESLEKPEGNVTGVSNFVSIEKQFAYFKKLHPQLKHLGVIYNPGEANSVTLVEQMENVAKNMGLTFLKAAATKTSDVLAAAQSLSGKVEAFFVNNDNTALSAFDSLVKIGNDLKIPVFVSDVDCVAKGALAALGPNQYKLGQQTATLVIRILKGEAPSHIPVEFPKDIESKINDAAAFSLGIIYEHSEFNEFLN